MTITLELPADMEGALAQEARRRGTTPESLALDGLRRLYGPPIPAPDAPDDPTLALFALWDAEDATDDPARRQHDGDALLASLRAAPMSLRRAGLPDEDAA